MREQRRVDAALCQTWPAELKVPSCNGPVGVCSRPPRRPDFLTASPCRRAFRRVSVERRLSPHEVGITFVGHSTFLIESAAGVTIATDYNGYAGGIVPRVVTMNHAHSSHYTELLDSAIEQFRVVAGIRARDRRTIICRSRTC
ncbi:MBL fold metallo-hydrolase [Breoghania sp.]|uniref:MBL fold metallo-hydrolase n=1 Tax=Breoghania sp. TaxID=2065378 RepID=UPI00260234C1|nr:MBL fold metallo-hydrolase [Breoghania sp.]MDJ0932841.1 MBL fold metallo-hydrolase [Breoghania sp.]